MTTDLSVTTKKVAVATAIAEKQGFRYAGLSAADKKFYGDQAEAALVVADRFEVLTLGTYRNHRNAELTVTEPVVGSGPIKTLGSGIYRAESRSSLFGTTTYLVTPSSMRGAGYKLVGEAF